MDKTRALIITLVLASFLIGAYFYPQLPERMASHWDAAGEVNGYMSRFWGVFFMPVFSVFLLALFFLIPRIDPLRENVAKFRSAFDGFILVIEAFFLYLYALTIAWNLGLRFDMTAMMLPGLSLIFIYMGFLLDKAERNFFIGIRTPWTLSSDRVWDKTHRLGAKLFRAVGLLTLLGLVFPAYAIFFFFVPVVAV